MAALQERAAGGRATRRPPGRPRRRPAGTQFPPAGTQFPPARTQFPPAAAVPAAGAPAAAVHAAGARAGGASADRFAALADGTRRHLLEQLATADRAVGELMTGLDISQAAVSQHLRVLREAGLVTARKAGRHRYYQLQATALAELRDWLDELEQFWQARLASLGEYLSGQLDELPDSSAGRQPDQQQRPGGEAPR